MLVYRIVKSKERTHDLSGIGAFRAGGRWNDKGTYALYTSENSSLAFLENLAHFDADDIPENLFIAEIELNITDPTIFSLPDKAYPNDWLVPDNLACKKIGDAFFAAKLELVLKVRSAVNQSEYNYLLNPLFQGYHELVKVINITKIPVDSRLS